MPPPLPLTQTPAPALDWSRPGTPAASDFGDIYFSTDGGLEETRTVFLKGCGLPEAWAKHPVFTIAELGFGSGLNFLATWQMWQATAKSGQSLHFVSIEKYPFDRAQLTQALSAWPELAMFSEQLIAQWPGRVKGFHRLHFGSVSLTLIHEDVAHALDSVSGLAANAWFLDGFSPSRNADMWSDAVLEKVGECSAPNAQLATFSVAGSVRTALKNAGFEVWKTEGFGRKRHRLEARYKGQSKTLPSPMEKALIVGAGIAGRSLAQALTRRHIAFDIIDSRDHPAASGNPAALVKPRFDLQDRPESRFFLSAYLYALRYYEAEATLETGVTQIPKTPEQAKRYQKLAQQNPLGEDQLNWIDDHLDIVSARIIDPAKTLSDISVQHQTYDPDIAQKTYSHIFLAAGYGIRDLAPDLALRYSRGQLSWAETAIPQPIAYGGYAIPLGDNTLVGATHDRLDETDPFDLRAEDDVKNLAAYHAITGQNLTLSSQTSRASVRVTRQDTLPLMAKLNDKIWVLTGLGSRGFSYAPLLAEALIAEVCGEVSPLERAVIASFRKD